jgi:hypothetical protein
METTAWIKCFQKISGHILIFQMPKRLISELNRALVHLQVNIVSLQAKTSLEAYFLSLTRSKQYVAPYTD